MRASSLAAISAQASSRFAGRAYSNKAGFIGAAGLRLVFVISRCGIPIGARRQMR
jgi:hypothetical protein